MVLEPSLKRFLLKMVRNIALYFNTIIVRERPLSINGLSNFVDGDDGISRPDNIAI